jgi:hypothetical protein
VSVSGILASGNARAKPEETHKRRGFTGTRQSFTQTPRHAETLLELDQEIEGDQLDTPATAEGASP